MELSARNRFFFNSFVSITGSLVAGVFNYVFHFLVSRRLSVAQYGELQTLISLVAVLGIFATTFLNASIKSVAGFVAQEREHPGQGIEAKLSEFISTARQHTYSAVAWLLLILLLLSPVFVHLLHLQSYWGLFFVYAAAGLSIVTAVDNGVLNGNEDFVRTNFVSFISALVKFIVGVAIAIYFAKASYVAFAFFVAGTSALILYRKFSKRYLSGGLTQAVQDAHHTANQPVSLETKIEAGPVSAVIEEIVEHAPKELPKRTWYKLERELVSTMAPIFIFSFLLVLAGSVDVLIVKNVAGAQTVGFYSAFETLGNIMLFVNGAIIAVILPKACGEGRLGKPVNYAYLMLSYGLLALVSAAGIIAYKFFPEPIINTLYGSRYVVIISNLWLFALLAAAMSFLTLEANVAFARHDFFISYILGLTCVGIIIAVGLRHDSVRQIITGVVSAITGGWILAVIRHIFARRRYADAQELLISSGSGSMEG